ncbi:MAG: pitrilysin family protein [Bryobacterales bacterium]|nr:insulinase family protein [Bryobacteraceae bacterium]MDW8128961.1 pitrilysin family protein [Bryobacterales bacterium]
MPAEVQRTVLPNGVRVISERMPQVRSVSVGIWLGTGARLEAPHETGICHFLEHLLFKGTRKRSAEEIARSVDSIGGNLDAFTGKEMVSFNAKVLDEHLPLAFDVLADLVTGPLLRPEDIRKEKGVILEEIKMELDNPEYLVHEIFASNFWKGHALGRPILGTRETVQRFTPEMVENYYRRVYIPSNILVTAAGNLDHERLVELAAEHFRDMPAGDGLPEDKPPVTHARLALRHKKSLEQIHLCLGVPAYPAPHRERFASYVLNVLLGGGMSSRLFQNIRERQGLAYAVFSELNPYRDTGCLSIYAGTSVDAARKVVQLILVELRRFKEEPVSEEELRRGKDYLKGSLILGLESTSHRMANLARQELYFGRFFSLDELIEDIERVTAADVQRVAQQFFDSRLITLTMLGNLDGVRFRREELDC